jgi:hypothetical protein
MRLTRQGTHKSGRWVIWRQWGVVAWRRQPAARAPRIGREGEEELELGERKLRAG